MKMTVNEPKRLLDAVRLASWKPRGSLPILDCVLLKADEAGLVIRGTDLDSEAIVSLAIGASETGQMAVNARSLISALGNGNGDGPVTLDDGKLIGRHGEVLLPTLPVDEFPVVLAGNGGKALESVCVLDSSELLSGLKRTAFASSEDVSRYILQGVLLEQAKGQPGVRLVATDGRRLAIQTVKSTAGVEKDTSLIVPTAGVEKLVQLLGKAHGPVLVSQCGENTVFSSGGWLFTTKQIEGNYPNYRQVIPAWESEKSGPYLLIDPEAMIPVLDSLASVLKSEDAKSRSVALDVSNGKVVITAKGATFNVIGSGKGQVRIAFDVRYLSEGLKAVKGEAVCFKFTDGLSPALIETITGFTYVLMPMRMS